MADEVDIAQDLQEREIANARAENERNASKRLPATGSCHYCSTSVGEEARFCDEECARDWEEEQRLLKIAGKVPA